MTSEPQLERVADRYRTVGYDVVLRPGPDQLPAFAKDFRVELLATRKDESALVVAKDNLSAVRADPNLQRYAAVTAEQPGWRLDLVVLGYERQPAPPVQGQELDEAELRRTLDDIERMAAAGFVPPAITAAWAALEAAMRAYCRGEYLAAARQPDARTMLNELVSSGGLSFQEFRDLEHLLYIRGQLEHGFVPPELPPDALPFLVATARRLLDEGRPVKQSA